MSATVIARRYAKALLNLAAKQDQIDAVAEGLDNVASAIAASSSIREILNSPRVGTEARTQIIEQLLVESKAPPLVETFIRFLAHKHRTALIVEAQEVFHELADARLGRAQAEIVVASPIDDAAEDRLKQICERLSHRQISLSVRVDPNILGGAVTRIGSTVWDGSLLQSLAAMRQAITQGQIAKE